MKGTGRRIIVDADVGTRAASPRWAEHGRSCDEAAVVVARSLKAMLEARHVAVFSPRLQAEWRAHVKRGSAGRKWWIRMAELRLMELLPEEPSLVGIDELIVEHLPKPEREGASKDAHLIASAMLADGRIVSCDEKARRKFARLAAHANAVGQIHWANAEADQTPAWLLERAPKREDIMLRAPSDEAT